MSYIPLHVHSHYSLQLGLSKPKDISDRCLSLGIKSCALTDSGNISGAIAFYKEMTANNIKPILGCEIFITDHDASIKNTENESLSKITILCKNLKGWQSLINIVSQTNSEQFFHKKPRIDLENLQKLVDNDSLICITGYYGSSLWKNTTSDNQLKLDWENIAKHHIEQLNSIFGEENVFIEIQLFNDYYNQLNVMEEFRLLCKQENWRRIASSTMRKSLRPLLRIPALATPIDTPSTGYNCSATGKGRLTGMGRQRKPFMRVCRGNS